ncbi:MAG: glycosyltransferase, partial [Prevotella sp.]|nr:glycosyltransferase [Prevotella sp.]
MTVAVLMSTYNGEKYLREQLNSILAQDEVCCKILVRDDGSSDSTVNILNDYQEKGLLTWYRGKNMGPAKSFMQLLYDADDADFFAFSDQDDYWKPEKLKVAVESLKGYTQKPAFYFSQTQLADKDLNPIESVKINPLLTFGESLVYEFCGGCTIVMNRELRNILKTYSPCYIPMHDVWAYSVALAIGAKVVFDKTPQILYRQHGDNTIGQGNSDLHEWKRRMRRLIGKEHSRWRRACEIKKGFYELMPIENKEIVDMFVNGKKRLLNRIRLLYAKQFECSNKHT